VPARLEAVLDERNVITRGCNGGCVTVVCTTVAQRTWIVLDQPSIVHPQDSPTVHVPPRDRLGVYTPCGAEPDVDGLSRVLQSLSSFLEGIIIFEQPRTIDGIDVPIAVEGDVALVALGGAVHFHEVVGLEVFVLVGIHTNLGR